MGAHNEHQSLNKKRSKSNTIASNCYLDYIKVLLIIFLWNLIYIYIYCI